MPGSLRIRDLVVPDRELDWRFSRSSGPGGQHVNTTDSRVELSWDLVASEALATRPQWRERALQSLAERLVDGRLVVVSSEHRSQLRNREAALARMRRTVEEAVKPPGPPRRPTSPSRAARRRRRDEKRARGRTKALRRRPPQED
ncbi:MAG TPA: alternative ribosome rescue aminoacyl-tRNA hydrolase ArfB [Jiangellales bacterium]|nr:alternative ribosome rescue aminoacyl-tRNA hydrolase ArfB [Jiangellales bacterium]